MDRLDALENRSVHILREASANFRDLAMLWSIGKDSTVLLWLARKAFFGNVPFPLIHIDTGFKIPEMIRYRDRLAADWNLSLMVGQNRSALGERRTFPEGAVDRITCCSLLKTEALAKTLSGEWPRHRFSRERGVYEPDGSQHAFTAIITGVRADEEGSRSKERYFSPRGGDNSWAVEDQPPEFWDQYKTEFAPGTHVRIHPLLDWTELNIWEYIDREGIPTVPLYYNQGDGKRYRSLGCYPCTFPILSEARNPKEIIEELRSGQLARVAERSGRAQDQEDEGGLESLRRKGYM